MIAINPADLIKHIPTVVSTAIATIATVWALSGNHTLKQLHQQNLLDSVKINIRETKKIEDIIIAVNRKVDSIVATNKRYDESISKLANSNITLSESVIKNTEQLKQMYRDLAPLTDLKKKLTPYPGFNPEQVGQKWVGYLK